MNSQVNQIREYLDYNTVAKHQDVILVGEAHGFDASITLVQDLIELVDPAGICIESSSMLEFYLMEQKTAMHEAVSYAKSNDRLIGFIDRRGKWIHDQIKTADYSETIENINQPQSNVMENGNVDADTIKHARERTKRLYGKEAYETIFEKREEFMARRINGFNQLCNGTVLCVIGMFHLPAIHELIEYCRPHIEKERCHNL